MCDTIIKYKGEIIDPKDIEISWTEYSYNGNVEKKSGDFDDYSMSKYKIGYDNALDSFMSKISF